MKKSVMSDEMQENYKLLKYVQERDNAAPFCEPVDWRLLNLPDYPQIVTHPMDLGTIQKRLEAGKYSSSEQFAADVRLVWSNAKKYNLPGSGIYLDADNLSKLFEKKYARLIKQKSFKRKTIDASDQDVKVTQEDKIRFTQLIKQLSSEELGQVVEIIERQCPTALDEDELDLEIEINNIDAQTLLQLNAYAESCIKTAEHTEKKRKIEEEPVEQTIITPTAE